LHASSDSGAPIGQRAAVALAASLAILGAAGCTTQSGDQSALNGVSAPSTTAAPTLGGPAVTFTGPRPTVAGHPAAASALTATAARLPSGCTGLLERSDPHLVSVVWRCGTAITAATVTLDGHPLALGDILHGGYASYLSSVASSQFAVEGEAKAPTTDLGTWYLTPAALAVAFPAGVVSYPLASLAPYLRDPSGL